MKHQGVSAYRIPQNPVEGVFAEEWREQNEQARTLDHILKNHSVRDEEVAATIVQWLGSPVGMCFLRDTINKSPELHKFLDLCIFKK